MKGRINIMTDKLRVGLNETVSTEVSEDMLAQNVGSGDTAVLATPMLLNAMETLCSKMISDNLQSKELTSVGTVANIKHLSPTPCGMNFKTKSTIIGLDRKKVTFRVEVHDQKDLIGFGIHERIIVDRERFNKRAASKTEE